MNRIFSKVIAVAMVTITIASPVFTPGLNACCPTHNSEFTDDPCKKKKADPKECDECEESEDDGGAECPDKSQGQCESCTQGSPAATLETDGKFYIRDTPFWYKSGLGPSFLMQMRYEPSVKRLVKNDPCGHNWSIAYLDYNFELTSSTTAKFYFGNGWVYAFSKINDVWTPVVDNGDGYTGTIGRPDPGQNLWVSDNPIELS